MPKTNNRESILHSPPGLHWLQMPEQIKTIARLLIYHFNRQHTHSYSLYVMTRVRTTFGFASISAITDFGIGDSRSMIL